jgi:hypothetical protein
MKPHVLLQIGRFQSISFCLLPIRNCQTNRILYSRRDPIDQFGNSACGSTKDIVNPSSLHTQIVSGRRESR